MIIRTNVPIKEKVHQMIHFIVIATPLHSKWQMFNKHKYRFQSNFLRRFASHRGTQFHPMITRTRIVSSIGPIAVAIRCNYFCTTKSQQWHAFITLVATPDHIDRTRYPIHVQIENGMIRVGYYWQ